MSTIPKLLAASIEERRISLTFSGAPFPAHQAFGPRFFLPWIVMRASACAHDLMGIDLPLRVETDELTLLGLRAEVPVTIAAAGNVGPLLLLMLDAAVDEIFGLGEVGEEGVVVDCAPLHEQYRERMDNYAGAL